jgi:5-hydroxyisourate hydrolase
MRVRILRLSPAAGPVAEGQQDESGTLPHPVVQETLPTGTYEAQFDAGAFFTGAALELTDPPFLGVVSFRFNLTDPTQHYHLPLKITPWGFSVFRGA